jgi:predicted nucleic acid-binding protein
VARYVIDAGVALHLAREATTKIPAKHSLLAPTLLRSQTLSLLHEGVLRGKVREDDARDQLARIQQLPIRLLGDAVLRRRAWEIATQLRMAETYDAEYVALTQLQGDAFVTLDAKLARRVGELVETASVEAIGAKR